MTRAPRRPVQPGEVFDRLTVVSFAGMAKDGRQFECQCLCGNRITALGKSLRGGNTRSCGCKQREAAGSLRRSHGLSKTVEYRIWKGMKDRCYNPNDEEFVNYGGRGIAVCDEWVNDFERFLKDVGPRPSPELTIDRIDNNIGYRPGNVRWATRADQVRNTRRTRIDLDTARLIRSLRVFGPSEISRHLGVAKQIVKHVLAGRTWA